MEGFPRNGSYLLVASTGGHLAQLNIIYSLINAQESSHWVTFDTPQSRSILGERPRTFVDYVGPREARNAAKTLRTFHSLLKSRNWDAVVSTGAAIAIPALAAASLHRVPAVYLESVSRVEGPSLSGKIANKMPGVECYTQHKHWQHGSWKYEISVFDAFTDPSNRAQTTPVIDLRDDRQSSNIAKIFVSLGTIRPYRFDSLVDGTLAGIAGNLTAATWQLGETAREDLPGTVFREMPNEDFERMATDSDIVITHAGVATCLRLVQLGIHPIVVPRRAKRGEHVDDHQTQIARELQRRGLCSYVESEGLADHLQRLLEARHSHRRLLPRERRASATLDNI